MRYSTREQLARDAIENALCDKGTLSVNREDVPSEWRKKKACFVTLKKGGILRGCIGSIKSFEELYKNIIRNAVGAAFDDPRFPPLRFEELKSLEIEVSILTEPKIYLPNSVFDLLDFLSNNKPGLILEKGGQKALFLPQVWEDIKKPEDFLSRLCLKAGLPPLEWKNIHDIDFRIFNIE